MIKVYIAALLIPFFATSFITTAYAEVLETPPPISDPNFKEVPQSEQSGELVPLWILELNLMAVSLDAYPGSDFKRTIVLPFPNFRLNSPYLQTSGGGVNARIFNSEKVDLGLTMGGSLPVKNKELESREDRDLPDLDPTFEIGMGLRYTPIKNKAWELKSNFPIRKSTGIAYEDQDKLYKAHKPVDLGWTFSPRVTLVKYFKNKDVHHEIDFEIGSRYATQQNMNYFYGVESQFALPGEGAFLAEQGLVNNWVELGWIRKWERWRLSISAEYLDMHNAKNSDSPLFQEKDSWFGFIILSYNYTQSNLTVVQDSEFRN